MWVKKSVNLVDKCALIIKGERLVFRRDGV